MIQQRKYIKCVPKLNEKHFRIFKNNKLTPRSITENNISVYNSSVSVSSIPEITAILSKLPPVLDQGMQGTCIANSMAVMMYVSLGPTGRPFGNNKLASPNIISTCALQCCENLVMNGYNPAFLVNNPLLNVLDPNNDTTESLMMEGGWYALASSALMNNYIPSESIWNRPSPWQSSIANFYSPSKSFNPLISSTSYVPSSNGKYSISKTTVFSANFEDMVFTSTSFNFSSHSMTENSFIQMYTCFLIESIPLLSSNAAANQSLLLNDMIAQLLLGNALGISFSVDLDFEEIGSDGLYLPNSLIDPYAIQGDHATVIVGVINGSTWRTNNPGSSKFNLISPTDKLFIIRNSWGNSWGNNGNFYIRIHDFFNTLIDYSYGDDYINTLFTQSFYVIKAASK